MKKYILIIDDEQLMCYGLKKALRKDLLEVDTASTASETILALSSCNYDLCLLDIRIPDDSGFKMMEVIRDFCPKIKIVLMTASTIHPDNGLNETILKAREHGACHLLCKPFDLKQLKEVIFRVLREDSDVDTRDWCQESVTVNTRRMVKRKKWSEKIHFYISVINDGAVERKNIPGVTVDISDEGVGLITPYILKPTQIVSFDGDLDRKVGVVVWSTSLDDERCRAGIRFA